MTSGKTGMTYAQAGVDIDAGNALVDRIKPAARRTVRPGVSGGLGGFGALFDLLGQLRASFADPAWATPSTLFTGFAFTGMIYFAFCFAMSRYSLFVERRLNIHRRS